MPVVWIPRVSSPRVFSGSPNTIECHYAHFVINAWVTHTFIVMLYAWNAAHATSRRIVPDTSMLPGSVSSGTYLIGTIA